LSQVQYGGNWTASYLYDIYGRPYAVTRPGFATQTTYYSVINRPDSIKNGVDTLKIKYGYDATLNTSITDPKRQTYAFTYNALGWATTRTDPAGGTDSVYYSVDGDVERTWSWIRMAGYASDGPA
jgi:YD repeat-containing protein